ncbi:MAG: rhomboid family intramembrane serine protease [Cytophagales bacterium]|nr:MAG: rhomboid family intramembrane serine protease [Cytophagales bacterium]
MKLTKSFTLPLLIVFVFWAIRLAEIHTNIQFTYLFGLYPRTLFGLLGILSSPFVHGNWFHLLSNAVPFTILGGSILFFYPLLAKKVIFYIYLLTGMSVWLFARPSFHIGSSGLVYGFAGFLFFSGVFRRDMKSISIALAVAFLYGGLVVGIFPTESDVSFESHLFGAISGSICAFAYKNIKEDEEESPQKEVSNNVVFEGYRNIEGKKYRYVFKPEK